MAEKLYRVNSCWLDLSRLLRKKYISGTVKSGQEAVVGGFIGNSGEPSTVVLLNGHSIKLPSKGIL